MNFTIIAVGTRGDVQPAIALGRQLIAAGHRVRLVASAPFHDWITSYGLEVAGTRVNIHRLMESEGGVEWVERGHNPLVQTRLMKRLLDQHGWDLVWDAWQGCQDADVIISSLLSDTYTTAIAEKLDVPQISMVLQPSTWATRDGRVLLNAPLPGRRSLINTWFGKLLIEPFPWQMLGDLTTRLRQELDLPPQTAAENKALRRELLTLHAYSLHVVPHPVDWPPNFYTTGYWFLDEPHGWQPPDDLVAFLKDGPPPVYLGFGSMTGRSPEATTRLIVGGIAGSGRRAIVSAGWAGLGAVDLPAGVFKIGFVPHDWLFPQLAAVVHHGGAGTTAAGLRAGIPTFIIPHMADQPFWGQRIHALGVGPRPQPRHRLTAEKLAAGISAAAANSEFRRRAAELGRKIRAEDGVATAVNLIERWLD